MLSVLMLRGGAVTMNQLQLKSFWIGSQWNMKTAIFFNCGFLINKRYPFLGATPDGIVHCHVMGSTFWKSNAHIDAVTDS